MDINRRELCSLLPVLFSSSWISNEPGLASGAFAFDDLHARTTDAAEFRSILKGTTRTGEQVEVHETLLHPGALPHPPRRHTHSEFWLIREGTVDITINGQPHRLGPGSAAFASSNDEHSIKNVGTVSAAYFVVAIGPMT